MFCDQSAIFPTPLTPLTITFEQLPDQKCCNIVIVRKRNLCDPFDYHCDSFDAAHYGAYDCNFRFPRGCNDPYDYDADASVHQAFEVVPNRKLALH